MHLLAGLQCCFSSGTVCHYCLAQHRQLRMLHNLDDCIERTSAAHKSHLKAFTLDPAINGPLYGITNVSPLQGLEKFDVTEQLPPDAMHDILEGGIDCVLPHVLEGLVADGVIRKQDLGKKLSFKYGFHDKKAIPPAIRDVFRSGKASLRGSASQKWCLFRLLPQIYAEYIPEGNPHCMVYLAFRHPKATEKPALFKVHFHVGTKRHLKADPNGIYFCWHLYVTGTFPSGCSMAGFRIVSAH